MSGKKADEEFGDFLIKGGDREAAGDDCFQMRRERRPGRRTELTGVHMLANIIRFAFKHIN